VKFKLKLRLKKVHGDDQVHGIDQGGEQGEEAQEVAP
jgi:hypothetical protein